MRLVLLAAIWPLLFGCKYLYTWTFGPKFQVGDCMILTSDLKRIEGEGLERWQEPPKSITMELIIEVGKRSYRTMYDFSGIYLKENTSSFTYDNVMSKIKCSESLEEIKRKILK